MPSKVLRYSLLALVSAVLVWSGVSPHSRGTWFTETIWAIAGLVIVVAFWRKFPLTAVTCIVLASHAVVLAYGGHTSYAETPLGDWVQSALDLDRNPYDRLGHFMQGFAPAIAAREILWRTSPLKWSRWLAPMTVCFCLALSAFWELLEWWSALLVMHGDPAFLGAQGDPWDTQWDMLLALVGAVTALLLLTRVQDRQLKELSEKGSD